MSGAEARSEATVPVNDPLENFPSHALIEFQGMTDRKSRKVAKKLKAHAVARGCLFVGA